jgi:hypothetical protein
MRAWLASLCRWMARRAQARAVVLRTMLVALDWDGRAAEALRARDLVREEEQAARRWDGWATRLLRT